MTGRRTLKRALGDLSDRGLIARKCGARMFYDGQDWMTLVAGTDFNPRPWLSADEAKAWETLLPGTWWAQWWRGWNDAAAEAAGD